MSEGKWAELEKKLGQELLTNRLKCGFYFHLMDLFNSVVERHPDVSFFKLPQTPLKERIKFHHVLWFMTVAYRWALKTEWRGDANTSAVLIADHLHAYRNTYSLVAEWLIATYPEPRDLSMISRHDALTASSNWYREQKELAKKREFQKMEKDSILFTDTRLLTTVPGTHRKTGEVAWFDVRVALTDDAIEYAGKKLLNCLRDVWRRPSYHDPSVGRFLFMILRKGSHNLVGCCHTMKVKTDTLTNTSVTTLSRIQGLLNTTPDYDIDVSSSNIVLNSKLMVANTESYLKFQIMTWNREVKAIISAPESVSTENNLGSTPNETFVSPRDQASRRLTIGGGLHRQYERTITALRNRVSQDFGFLEAHLLEAPQAPRGDVHLIGWPRFDSLFGFEVLQFSVEKESRGSTRKAQYKEERVTRGRLQAYQSRKTVPASSLLRSLLGDVRKSV